MNRFFIFCGLFFLIPVAVTAQSSAVTNAEFAEISKVLDFYFDGKTGVAEEEAMLKADKMTTISGSSNAPPVLIIDYLSGNLSLTPPLLMISCENNKDLRAMANFCVFIRKIAKGGNMNSLELENYLDNFMKMSADTQFDALKKLRKKAELFKKWCGSGFRPLKGLPRLLMVKSIDGKTRELISKHGDILKLSFPEYKKTRTIFAKRPKIYSLSFTKRKLQKYIDGLPSKKLKHDEIKRVNIVNKIKPYIIKLLARNPYHGRIPLRKGSLKGTISMANEEVVVVLRKGHSSSKAIKWEYLSPDMMINFVEYYARQRLESYNDQISIETRKKQAADDYLQLAFFLDWFGDYNEALKYIKKAVKLSSGTRIDADFLVYGGS